MVIGSPWNSVSGNSIRKKGCYQANGLFKISPRLMDLISGGNFSSDVIGWGLGETDLAMLFLLSEQKSTRIKAARIFGAIVFQCAERASVPRSGRDHAIKSLHLVPRCRQQYCF